MNPYLQKIFLRCVMLMLSAVVGAVGAGFVIVLPSALLKSIGAVSFSLEDSALMWPVLALGGLWSMAHGLDSIVEITNKRRPVGPPTEAERNQALMRATLPPWRRIGGWLSPVIAGLSFWIVLFLAIRHGERRGWVYLVAVIASLVVQMVGFWAMEWFWKPYREAQRLYKERERRIQP